MLRHIRVYGCLAEVKVYNLIERKLDSRTINGNLIGYAKDFEGYIYIYTIVHLIPLNCE